MVYWILVTTLAFRDNIIQEIMSSLKDSTFDQLEIAFDNSFGGFIGIMISQITVNYNYTTILKNKPNFHSRICDI
jgi:hypothetical protein